MRVIPWLGSLDAMAHGRADLPALDRQERERMRAFTDHAAATRFAALRRVQRVLVAEALGETPDRLLSSYECPECGPDAGHGRPGYRLLGAKQNTAHSTTTAASCTLSASRAGEWGAVVVVTDAPPRFRLGIDLTLERELFDGFDEVALSTAERDWIRSQPGPERLGARAGLWAAKEALSKRDGHGLRREPSQISVLGRAGLVDLSLATDVPIPRHRLIAAVPEEAEAAFRRATA
ncbi:4'-phosphopantetheinyl transferase family protein [Arthrobacter sp. NPDC090010]|uniref:4'-phosphopantetheinyl transferase family protein n=1 Tax=Arthrobacter sp. NPDC090010 TaxID=3363942 RepID=UPI00382EDA44